MRDWRESRLVRVPREHPGVLWCTAGGIALCASGLIYLLVWLGDGSPSWSGPLSYRKPILFGFSAGLTLLSLAWVLVGLRPRKWDSAVGGSLALLFVAEVGLIDLQHARHVPSHFNHRTYVDGAITNGMSVLILAATVLIIYLTVRSFLDLRGAPDDRLSAQAGLLLLVAGCLLGILITMVGEAQLQRGHSAETFAQAGVLKFPHGIPIHALQALPLLAWGLRRWGVSLETRVRAVGLAAFAFAAATVYGCVQTFAGAPRLPPTLLGWPWVMAVGVFALAAAAAVALDERT